MKVLGGLLVVLAIGWGYILAAYLLASLGLERRQLLLATGVTGTGLAAMLLVLLLLIIWPPFSLVSLFALVLLISPLAIFAGKRRRSAGNVGAMANDYSPGLRSRDGPYHNTK